MYCVNCLYFVFFHCLLNILLCFSFCLLSCYQFCGEINLCCVPLVKSTMLVKRVTDIDITVTVRNVINAGGMSVLG